MPKEFESKELKYLNILNHELEKPKPVEGDKDYFEGYEQGLFFAESAFTELFEVTVSDGSGETPLPLLSEVDEAIDNMYRQIANLKKLRQMVLDTPS